MPAPAPAPARPERVLEQEHTSRDELERRRYRRVFRLHGLPGTHQLQRVDSRIRFSRGDRLLVEYRALYWEYFGFGTNGERLDVHDFDQARDGWSQGPLRRLLRRHGIRASGPARLEYEKTFRLAAGAVEGVAPAAREEDGGTFGYLEAVDGEATELIVRVGGERVEPFSRLRPTPTGRGSLGSGPQWRAVERYVEEPATLHVAFEATDYETLTEVHQ